MLVDPLSDVLSLLKPHTYVAGGFDLGGEWSIGFEPHNGIKCYALLTGACSLVLNGGSDTVRLEAGDCILLPGGRRFHLTNDPALSPTPLDRLQSVEWRGGIVTVAGGGEALILGGHFAFAGAHADVLLGAMPPVAHLRDDSDRAELRWALERMRRELTEARPGGVLVAQHLAHLMLVQALRLYLAGRSRASRWLAVRARRSPARGGDRRDACATGRSLDVGCAGQGRGYVTVELRAGVQGDGGNIAHRISDAMANAARRHAAGRWQPIRVGNRPVGRL